jgi:hypothetical protein
MSWGNERNRKETKSCEISSETESTKTVQNSKYPPLRIIFQAQTRKQAEFDIDE